MHGRMLRLVAADDGYEPTRTAETMKQLYDKDQVFGFIGNYGTATAMVSAPFALDRQTLFYAGFTGANVLRRDPPDRYVFNFRASYERRQRPSCAIWSRCGGSNRTKSRCSLSKMPTAMPACRCREGDARAPRRR